MVIDTSAIIAILRLEPQAKAYVAREAFLRYGKGRHSAALNFGDCASYALARVRRLPLLFKGEDFARTDIDRAIA